MQHSGATICSAEALYVQVRVYCEHKSKTSRMASPQLFSKPLSCTKWLDIYPDSRDGEKRTGGRTDECQKTSLSSARERWLLNTLLSQSQYETEPIIVPTPSACSPCMVLRQRAALSSNCLEIPNRGLSKIPRRLFK